MVIETNEPIPARLERIRILADKYLHTSIASIEARQIADRIAREIEAVRKQVRIEGLD